MLNNLTIIFIAILFIQAYARPNSADGETDKDGNSVQYDFGACDKDAIFAAGSDQKYKNGKPKYDRGKFISGQCAYVSEKKLKEDCEGENDVKECMESQQNDCEPDCNYNFLKMYYCSMESSFGETGKLIAIVPIGALLMLILMYNLSSTADEYLSPSLEFLTEKLGISESLAGVTLLAFGNGAPDVFAAISANGGDSGGSNDTLLSICNLVGSTLFISTIVQLMTVGAAEEKRIKVTPVFFIRDLIFYILMNLYLLFILVVAKQITMVISIGFILMYIIYVALVVVQSKLQVGVVDTDDIVQRAESVLETMVPHKLKRQNLVKFEDDGVKGVKHTLEEDNDQQERDDIGDELMKSDHSSTKKNNVQSSNNGPVKISEGQQISADLRTSGLLNVSGTKISETYHQQLYDNRKSQIDEQMRISGFKHDPVPQTMHDRVFVAQRMKRLFKEKREEGIWNNFMKLIEIPSKIAKDYTIPMAEHESWDRTRASIIPSTLILAFFYLGGALNNGFEDPWLTVGLICIIPGMMIGTGIYFKTKKYQAPEWLITTYAVICFVMSIMWIKFSSDCIMDLLQLFGFVSQLPTSLFGLTILAWGNCLGDLSADVAMTKKGFGEMAMTGTMAGPIFNVLVGMGLSMILKFATGKEPAFQAKVEVSIWTDNDEFNSVAVLPLSLIAGQIFVLLLLLVNVLTARFEVTRFWTIINSIVYVAITTFLVIFSIANTIAPAAP